MSTRGQTQRLGLPLMLAFRSGRGGAQASGADAAALPKRRFAIRLAATERLIREEVMADLSNLVNSISLEGTVELDDFKHVRGSILNYGIPDIASHTIDEHEVLSICSDIANALRLYEPRLVPDTIVVERDTSLDPVSLNLRFRVRADLSCAPVNVPVEFVADMELETHKIKIERQ